MRQDPNTHPGTGDSSEDSAEKLIAAATTLFAEQGYEGTSVKELAQLAGVNVSLVSYHFGGKEGLLRTCLERFGKQGVGIAQRVLQEVSSPEELKLRLKMFIEEIYQMHIAQPDVCRILHRECDMKESVAQDVFRNTFHKVFEALAGFLKDAQKKGFLRKEVDSTVATVLFMGATIHPARMARQSQEAFGTSIHDAPFRAIVVEHLLTLFTTGFGAPAGKAKS